jgi:phosphoribosylanthranilate isomerase
VFVNYAIPDIIELYLSGIIKIAQLHGGESERDIAELKDSGIQVIQAIRASCGDVPSGLADYHLFDGAEGGSGAAVVRSEVPNTGKPSFLAGGIDIANIEAAIKFKPFAVDISSGAETNGLKDSNKIDALIKRVRMEATYE